MEHDVAAHHLHQLLDDGQAQSRAAVFARSGAVGLAEWLEDGRGRIRRHADARIAHFQAQLAGGGTADIDGNFAPFGEFGGVIEQVGEYLAQAHRVAAHMLRHVGSDAAGKFDGLALDAVGKQCHHVVDHLAQVEGDVFEHQLARLDLGKVEDVVDDAQQAFTRAVHRVHETLLLGTQFSALQQFRHAQHAIHRRADFMAHLGQEFRFCAVGGVGLGLGLRERQVALFHVFEHAVEARDQLPQFIAAVLRHAHRQRLAVADMRDGVGQARQRPGDGRADQACDGHAGQQQHQRDAEDQHEGMPHAIAYLGHRLLLLARDARHLLCGIGGLFAFEGAHVVDHLAQRLFAIEHAALGLHQPLSRALHRFEVGVDGARFGQQAQLAYALQQGLHGGHVALQGADAPGDIVAQARDVAGGRGEHDFAHVDADGVDGQVDFTAGIFDAGRGVHVAAGLRQPVAPYRQLQFDGIEFLGQAQVGGGQGGADLFLESKVGSLLRRAGAALGQQSRAQGQQAGARIEQLARRGQQFRPQGQLRRADVALAGAGQVRHGRGQALAQGGDAETALHGLRFGQRNLHVVDALAQIRQVAGVLVQTLALQLHFGGRGLGLVVDQADIAARAFGRGLDLRQQLAHLRRLRLVIRLVFQAFAHGDAHALEFPFEGRVVAGRLQLAMAPQIVADALGGLDIGDDLV